MFPSNFTFNIWFTVITAVSSVAVGAALYALWLRNIARKRTAIPKEWPLTPRVLANSEERKVWSWLCKVFHNDRVMIKIPVTRFTFPRKPKEGQHLYNLLSGVYCTLTVCAPSGRVIGCVDVMGRRGISRSNMRLKRTLLSQCGMAYLVVEPENLPSTVKIRTLFLGKEAGLNYDDQAVRDEAKIAIARAKLSTALERQRRTRQSDSPHNEESPSVFAESILIGDSSFGTSSSFGTPTEFGTEWQKDSFMAPLDSRKGELHR